MGCEPGVHRFDGVRAPRVFFSVAACPGLIHPCGRPNEHHLNHSEDLTTPNQVRLIPVRTYSPKPADIQRVWHVIDAEDIVLGRLAVEAATLLRGKHKPMYAPHMDVGDFVIVINAEKVYLSGDKRTNKLAYRHSGFPGGLTATPIGEILAKDPRKAIESAVWGMLPKNKLSRAQLKKLKVYAGPEHPHEAQQAVPFEIKQISQ
jgi:large subunit ribosomal protein L13